MSPFSVENARHSSSAALPRRYYRPGINLSILGFGGLMLAGMDREQANFLVAESVELGVNYFDVAPSYGNGNAEEALGAALEPYRKSVFLACKTLERSAAAARHDLERSLRRLRTEYVDLYQFHAVNKVADVEKILAPEGAAETVLRARDKGLVRFVGFSSHSVPVALLLLDRFNFDSILFPVNFICYARGNFGPQVLEKARRLGVARIALKSLAHAARPQLNNPRYPNCWYSPIDDPGLALQALRFSLSEDVTAVIPPADERLYRMAVELVREATPLAEEERRKLLASARGLKPIMWAKRQ
jgi:predicted aldo/keto reductase-like oxidoreductase